MVVNVLCVVCHASVDVWIRQGVLLVDFAVVHYSWVLKFTVLQSCCGCDPNLFRFELPCLGYSTCVGLCVVSRDSDCHIPVGPVSVLQSARVGWNYCCSSFVPGTEVFSQFVFASYTFHAFSCITPCTFVESSMLVIALMTVRWLSWLGTVCSR